MKYHFDTKRRTIVVNLELENHGKKVNLDVLLDTGAARCLISNNVAQFLGCDPGASSERIQIVSASGMEICPLVYVEKARALGVEIFNLDFLCHDLPSATRVRGLLGANFLGRFEMIIDYKEGTVELK